MQDPSLRIDLGEVETPAGSLELTLIVSEAGDAHVQLSATGPRSRAGAQSQ